MQASLDASPFLPITMSIQQTIPQATAQQILNGVDCLPVSVLLFALRSGQAQARLRGYGARMPRMKHPELVRAWNEGFTREYFRATSK